MPLTLTIFASVVTKVISQISTSADLNCSFDSACRWRNASAVEDSGDFLIASSVEVGNRFNVTPSKVGPEEVFAYTHGPFDGAQKAILISDTISCQLGGGMLTFWYYRTGDSATLEVCVRQPPGSVEDGDLRCFPVFPRNHAHQWLFNGIEFPPLTQPFEFLIRSNYIQPFDIIAIDDIYYKAALCGSNNNRIAGKLKTNDVKYISNLHHQIRSRRDALSLTPPSPLFSNISKIFSTSPTPPPLIGYYDWKNLENSNPYVKHPTMLVVAQEKGEDAAMLSRISREIPLQAFVSLTNGSGSEKKYLEDSIEKKAVKNLIKNDPAKSIAYEAKNTDWEISEEGRITSPLTAAVYLERTKSDLNLSDKMNTDQQAINNFMQKLAPFVFPALASILKSSDTFAHLQSINENANYVASPQRLVMMRKHSGTVGKSSSKGHGSEALKIEKIKRNMYGISRKMHSEFTTKSENSDMELSEHKKVQTMGSARSTVRPVGEKTHVTDSAEDIDMKNVVALSNAEVEALENIQNKLSIKNINSRSTEGAGGKFTLFDDLKGTLFGNNFDGTDLVDKNLNSVLTNGYPKRLLPLYASPTSRRSVAKWSRGRAGSQWISRCPFTDCTFNAVNMCHYVSNEQLQDDEDLLLGNPFVLESRDIQDLPVNSVFKKWKLSNHKIANSLTGIMGDLDGDGWFAYAGETNNPATMFLMHTSQAIHTPEESRIDFYVHMAGKYGRLRVCLDSLQKCPFERTGQQLSAKTRKWTNFHVNISRGFHTIYFVADNLKKNYVIGLDDIQLLNKCGTASAPCTG